MTKQEKILLYGGIGLLGILIIVKMKSKKIISINELPFLSKIKTNQTAFGQKVIDISNDLNLDPRWLMVVMNNESGESSSIKNPTSSATGLIQFTAATAKGLGTDVKTLSTMSNLQQLDYVKKYFSTYANNINNVAEAYLAVFYPAALFQPLSWKFPDWAVKANPIFFTKGTTKQDFENYVNNKYSTYVV